jgi:hypothetical protein
MRILAFVFIILICPLVTLGQVPHPDEPQLPYVSGWEDAYEQDSLVEVHNAIKTDPLQIIRGEIGLFYERKISRRIAIEIGGGVTRRNWTYSWFNEDVDDLRRNISVRTGGSMRLGVRWYFRESNELNGLYIMPQIGRRVFAKRFGDLNEASDLSGVFHLDRREYTELNLTLGIQQLAISSNFVLDVYFGVGYLWRSGREVQLADVPDTYTYFTRPFSNHGFTPVIGVKLGWGF